MSYSSERPVTAVAESLGITSNMIYRWRQKYTPDGEKRSWLSSRTVPTPTNQITVPTGAFLVRIALAC